MQKQSPLARIWELGEAEHGSMILAVLSALVGVVLGMLPYYAAAQLILRIWTGQREISAYIPWLLLGLAGFVGRTVLYNLALARSHKATFSILKTIRQKILEKLPKLPLGTVLDMSSGKMKQIIVDQVDGMETTLAHLIPEMTANIAGPVLILIYLFVLDWRMALLSLVTIPVGMLCMMAVIGSYAKNYEGAVKKTQEMNGAIVEYIGGIEVIKAYNQGKTSYARFADRVRDNARYYYQWMKKSQMGLSLAYAIVPATLITILPAGWMMYQGGSLSADTFIITVILAMGIAKPLMAAMNFVDTFAQVGTTVESIDELLKAEEQQHPEEGALPIDNEIRLSHVSFGYHEGQNVLEDINLTIPDGKLTALTGSSGSGKSTIAKLIAGFWDISEGEITIGGVDIRQIPLRELYDRVAFVSQDNYLFDTTIRENIRMGRPTATDHEVEEAARASGCDSFIQKMEQGYETRTGSGGVHLSGGERQRVAIARAILKDAPIIILDEATAYIDPENEALIQQGLARLIQGKTVIIIAHRLSTIQDADQIVVVQDGRIQAIGVHETLRRECPLYEAMWLAHIGAKDGEEA